MRRARRLQVGLTKEVARRRGRVAACGGVLAGGRVGGDSGWLRELQGRTREVRVAPKQKMAADWEGLTLGGEETVTTVFYDRKSGRGPAILASEAGGLSHGRKAEATACLSSGERERSGKGERSNDRRF
jgi:hypothetical protein